jgi:YHS domain-containing protein
MKTLMKALPTSMAFATTLLTVSAIVVAGEPRNVAEYNLTDGVALKGYDPVAVYPEGGGTPGAGLSEFQLEHQGAVYFFLSATNRDAFLANPARYEPTYGGWCAYAMASGSKVDIQPTLYTLDEGRAHYFVSSRAKQNFDRDIAGFEARADASWKRISGEER